MRIHFIGVCGYAVSGLARVSKELGHEVTGSDQDAYPPTTDLLDQAGIPWADGHRAENILRWGRPDLVVQANDPRPGNPESEEARRLGIPMVSEAAFWGQLTKDRYRIVVCGSHGKTTTASLIAWILQAAGRRPGYRLGIGARDLGGSAAWGGGREFVFEGDEYTSASFDQQAKFLHFNANLAVLLNVDWDHPDVYPDRASYERVFRRLVQGLGAQDRLLAYSDDETVRRLLRDCRASVQTYGTASDADWQARQIAGRPDGMRFSAWHNGAQVAEVETLLSGEHNVLNALAALATSTWLEVPLDVAAEAIGRFRGAGRRFEIRGQVRGVTVIDDYAHHPTEVRATLTAAGERFKLGRVLACFVPHTYSRTSNLLDGYADAFAGCALVLIGPIEPARERHLAHTISAADVAARVRGAGSVATVDSASTAAERLAAFARPGDVIVCMSVRGFDDVAGRTVAVLERAAVG